MVPSRFTNLADARARFGDRVDRLAPFLLAADPLADAVVEAFADLPAGRGAALLDAALDLGIDAVPDAPPALAALFAELDAVPPWVDWAALDQGGELLRRAGLLGGMVLGTASLVLGYASPGGNKPLVLSGRLEQQAARRLHETSRFVQAVCQSGGMKRNGDGFVITVKVRLMHAQVRRLLLRSGRWDGAAWGVPLNQHDMAATTLLFSLVVLDGLRTLGLAIERDEAERYTQLWRYVGWVIGCDRALTPASELEARQLADLIQATQAPPDEDARALTRALLDAPLTDPRRKDERVARRIREIGRALVRGLLGDAMAEDLAVPRSALPGLVPAIRGVVGAMEPVRRRVPAVHREAVAVGTRYWARVVHEGLGGAAVEFAAPERLGWAMG